MRYASAEANATCRRVSATDSSATPRASCACARRAHAAAATIGIAAVSDAVTELRGVTVNPENSMLWFSVVVVMLAASWTSVAARACRTSPSARSTAAAAAATVGFLSCARRTASAKVTRTVGSGVCAAATAGLNACATGIQMTHNTHNR